MMKNRKMYEFLKYWEIFKNFLHKMPCQAWIICREVKIPGLMEFTVKQGDGRLTNRKHFLMVSAIVNIYKVVWEQIGRKFGLPGVSSSERTSSQR